MIKVIRAKLYGIKVTSADLDYHGSITLDLHPEWGGSPNLSDRRPTNYCGIRIHRPSDALRFRPNGIDFLS